MEAMMEKLKHAAPRVLKTACVSIVAGTATLAYAGGGLAAGTSAINTAVLWFYGLVGAGAGGYLCYVAVQCFGHKADWMHDFGGGIVKVVAAGASLVLAGWAFGLFA